MSALATGVEAFSLGQRVQTSFGDGTVSAISRIDSVLYVTLAKDSTSLYILRPEQVEAADHVNDSRAH